MKTYRNILGIAFICFAALLCSCEQEYYHNFNLKNTSTVKVLFRGYIGENDSTDFLVDKGQSIRLNGYTDQSDNIRMSSITTLYDSIKVFTETGAMFLIRWDKTELNNADLGYSNFYYDGDWVMILNNSSTEFTISNEVINGYRTTNGLPVLEDILPDGN
ncbi:hypothetical protein K4L44_14660 [Halosquirtibacter laminarini]|uniref:Uncharacterized protein n=1 Tax=Halosquirtibacter laminarini TaxID=3374600 RepID=A0AC61NK20_9BACT|nr:hypothetical protein K4L44_14660 [Prolixibacteraceae bacterium]